MATSPRTRPIFNRGKAVYPFVVHYIVTLYGIKELAARGIVASQLFRRVAEAPRGVVDSLVDEPNVARLLEQSRQFPPGELFEPLSLGSAEGLPRVNVDAADIAADLADNHSYLLEHTLTFAAAGLFASVWEAIKAHSNSQPI